MSELGGWEGVQVMTGVLFCSERLNAQTVIEEEGNVSTCAHFTLWLHES